MKLPATKKMPYEEAVERFGFDYFFLIGAMVGGCVAAIFSIAWWYIFIVTIVLLVASCFRFYLRIRKEFEENNDA